MVFSLTMSDWNYHIQIYNAGKSRVFSLTMSDWNRFKSYDQDVGSFRF